VVVVIDEAQNLDDPALELVRMLSNFETPREKLIQIILAGQPQLAEKIASPGLVQLRQRISMFACLDPLSSDGTQLYIDQRLRAAGYGFETPLFTKEALGLIAQHSQGIPRNINNLCFNSLSLGCALKRKAIDGDIVREVIADLDLDRLRSKAAPAPQPQQAALPLAPAFLLPASAPAGQSEWTTRIALATAVLLVLSAALFQSRYWWMAKPAVQANRAIPPAAVADTPLSSVTQTAAAAGGDSQERPLFPENAELRPKASISTIRVMPGRTLLRICAESFGECTPELLGEIRRLNPRLSNPDHIEPGQRIRLPLSAVTQNETAHQDEASLAQGGTR
jgi:hypothetical protein